MLRVTQSHVSVSVPCSQERSRQLRFRMFVARDTLAVFLLTQCVIIVLGLLIKACDTNSNIRNLFPDSVSAHEKTTCEHLLRFACCLLSMPDAPSLQITWRASCCSWRFWACWEAAGTAATPTNIGIVAASALFALDVSTNALLHQRRSLPALSLLLRWRLRQLQLQWWWRWQRRCQGVRIPSEPSLNAG
jgi:hypothetical protein